MRKMMRTANKKYKKTIKTLGRPEFLSVFVSIFIFGSVLVSIFVVGCWCVVDNDLTHKEAPIATIMTW
jgi:hypothetical protein